MFSICYVTTPSKELAKKIAGELVRKKLIACANIIPSVTSVYEWEGKICDDEECLMIMKSQQQHHNAVIDTVKSLHSYDVPEIIFTPISGGSPQYLKWLEANTTLNPTPQAPIETPGSASSSS